MPVRAHATDAGMDLFFCPTAEARTRQSNRNSLAFWVIGDSHGIKD